MNSPINTPPVGVTGLYIPRNLLFVRACVYIYAVVLFTITGVNIAFFYDNRCKYVGSILFIL